MKQILLIVFILICLGSAFSQTETDIQLAQHYYSNGEFDKATGYYEKIYNSNPSKVYFNRYFECLVQIKDYKTAEKIIKKQVAANKSDLELRVALGQFYEDIEEEAKAKKAYEEIIENVGNNPSVIIQAYQAFASKGKFDLAKMTLDKGRKVANYYPFNFQYADYYALTGNKSEMIREYLDYVELQPTMFETIQLSINNRMKLSSSEEPDFVLLKEALLQRAQKANSNLVFSEMIIWLFVQSKNFNGAYNQVVALDKRTSNDGYRVQDLGMICLENKDYATARKCFNYVMALGENGAIYFEALKSLLNTRYVELTTNRAYSQAEIDATLVDYENAITKTGKGRQSVSIILEYAHILAFYANKADKAIEILTNLMQTPGLTDIQKAQLKMQLADVHVLGGDIWEASLLYMQIDTDFKFESIGEEAKFKNARVFYFDGEFDFAQGQLNVLKEATSRLIANDAMQLSVFITDNFGLDSNYTVMTWFASSELLIEQHKYVEAFELFDSIQLNFPFHSLADEILFRKAKAMEMQGQWQKALDYYEDLLKFHGQDILADDALFRMADINDNVILNKEKALELYRRLAIDYKGSLFSAEARKRIRILRGDKNIEGDDDEL
jgi:tetratricopeptide (TPR) repeat protein